MNYQYELFISFKSSTSSGRTEDREYAQRFYQALSHIGFRVFFSNTILSENGVANYMLEIQNALEKSRAILVVYSRVEYIASGWVAQEWMTFLNLLMKDPGRSIYMFSINKDTSSLPPFLRPYECFEDFNSAISHLSNGLKTLPASTENGMDKRDFLNAYWGLFGNTDILDYIDRPLSSPFYNYEAYCLKSRYINGGDFETYIQGLEEIIRKKQNPLASYLLSRHYRDFKHLNLSYSRKLAEEAFASFQCKIQNSSEDSEIGLWILSNGQEYDGAYYMCDVIHDVLDAYDVKTDIRLLPSGSPVSPEFGSRRKIVLFWSDVCLNISEEFANTLKARKDKVLIGLNSFGANALSQNVRECAAFENNNADITKTCRILLS